jgi:N-acetylneuraminate synthase
MLSLVIHVGEGEFDFAMLGSTLNKYAPNISFIPEIWQGYKINNAGVGISPLCDER